MSTSTVPATPLAKVTFETMLPSPQAPAEVVTAETEVGSPPARQRTQSKLWIAQPMSRPPHSGSR